MNTKKLAVVTSASTGIGAAIAQLMKRRNVIGVIERFQMQHALQEEREMKLGHDLGSKVNFITH
jgi:short-subunit dehydrogenase